MYKTLAKICCFLTCWLSTCQLMEIDSWNSSLYQRLYTHVMSNYTRDAIGQPNAFDPVVITVKIQLYKIQSLDTVTGTLTTFMWIHLKWIDFRLSWNHQEFGGIEKFVVSSDKIWLPELANVNSVDDKGDLLSNFPGFASIYRNGNVRVIPRFRFNTACAVDMYLFPYDRQRCSVELANWLHTDTQIHYALVSDRIDLIYYEHAEEWNLLHTSLTVDTFLVPEFSIYNRSVHVQQIRAEIVIERISVFYTVNIVFPAFLITGVSCTVFLAPPESPAKISVGVSILMAFSVLLVSISNHMPPTTNKLPLIALFIVINFGVTSLSVILSVTVVAISMRSGRIPVDPLTRRIVFGFLSRVVMYRPKARRPNRDAECPRSPDDSHALHSKYGGIVRRHSVQPSNVLRSDREDPVSFGKKVDYEENAVQTRDGCDDKNRDEEELNIEIDEVKSEDEALIGWGDVARVLDRLFFLLISLFTIAASATLSVIYVKS